MQKIHRVSQGAEMLHWQLLDKINCHTDNELSSNLQSTRKVSSGPTEMKMLSCQSLQDYQDYHKSFLTLWTLTGSHRTHVRSDSFQVLHWCEVRGVRLECLALSDVQDNTSEIVRHVLIWQHTTAITKLVLSHLAITIRIHVTIVRTGHVTHGYHLEDSQDMLHMELLAELWLSDSWGSDVSRCKRWTRDS